MASSPRLHPFPRRRWLPLVLSGTDAANLSPAPAPTAHSPSTASCCCSTAPGSKAPPGLGSAPHPRFPLTRGSGPPGDRLEISRLTPEASLSYLCRGHRHPAGHTPYAVRPGNHPMFYSSDVASPEKRPWSSAAARTPPFCGSRPAPAPRGGPGDGRHALQNHNRRLPLLSYETALSKYVLFN